MIMQPYDKIKIKLDKGSKEHMLLFIRRILIMWMDSDIRYGEWLYKNTYEKRKLYILQ